MAYSSEEIQAAVERLVRSQVRRPVDTSGIRKVEVQFDDLREIAAGVFISYPASPYYVVSLGMNRLAGETKALLDEIDGLVGLIEATGRRTFPINNLTTLEDATNALVELETTLGARSGTTGITAPAYLRFSASSLAYLNHVGASIKQDGDIVPTPQEAKVTIPGSFNSVMDSYLAILDKEAYLRDAIGDYQDMKLPAAVAQSVVQRARLLLEEDHTDLNALTEEQRLEVARAKTLNIITARAIVETYVKGHEILSAFDFSGTVTPYADSDHEAEPAEITADIVGPYAIINVDRAYGAAPDSRDNNILTFALEGGATTVHLPPSFAAFLLGSGAPQQDPDLPAGEGDKVYMLYKKGLVVDPPEDPNPGWAENFDDNPDTPSAWYFPPENTTLIIEQLEEGVAAVRYTIELMDTDVATNKVFTPLPEDPEWPISWDAYREKVTLATVVSRVNAALSGASSKIRARESATGTLEMYIPDPLEAVVNQVLGIRVPSVMVGGAETNTAATSPLGFFPGLEMMSKRTAATSIVTWVTGSTSDVEPSLASLPRNTELDHMKAWTVVGNKACMALAKYTGYAVVVGGYTATFTLGANFDPTTVEVGDFICLPRQYVMQGDPLVFSPLADEGALYVISDITGQVVTATHLSGPVAESGPSRAVDIGLPSVLSQVLVHDVVEVFTAPNEGGYEITSIDTYSPFRVYFDIMLSQNETTRGALPLEMEVTAGPATVKFASADLTTLSSIGLTGTGRPLFFSTAVTPTRGRTEYVRLPDLAPRLQVGDTLEFKESLSPLVMYTRTIKNIEGKILTLDSTVPSDVQFTANGSAPPSVRILSGAKQTYDATVTGLESWESTEPQDATLYQRNTNAVLNPLLVNKVVPLGKVTEAKAAVQTLRDKVQALYDRLILYSAEQVPAVDDMLNTFKSKGADRAVDILLQGRFSEFFGLDMDDLTYSGAMQKAARDVARNDLAKSKFGTSRVKRRVISEVADVDPDTDFSDSDAMTSPVDPMPGLDLLSTPDRAQ